MRFALFITSLFFCFAAKAQITITSANMPVVGDTFPVLQDTGLVGFSVGQKGVNRTWDFSFLQPDVSDTTYAIDRTTTPYSSDFPNANLVLTNDFNAYLYYRNTSTALKAEGFASVDPNLGTVSVNNNPIPDQYRFPTAYQGTFSGTSGFIESKPYAQLPANIQAQITAALANCPNPGAAVSDVRVTFTSTFTDTIDGWGKVITPLGSYDALRRKRVENTHTVIEANTNCLFVYSWFPIVDTSSVAIDYSWLSTITKLPVVQLGYDNVRNIISATYSATPPPVVAGFTWTNPSGGLVNFTDTSHNATSYSWDFGDGGSSSTLQNPTHVYLANGAYYVCLTATNSAGDSTFCDSVHVTNISAINNPPIAARDSAHIVYPNTATIDVLANDVDPNNDAIVVTLVLQPLNGSMTDNGNGIIDYEANANFRGVDSFTYIIADDGSPIMKDTGTIVIDVDGLPSANFTYASNGFVVTFQNTSSVYTDSVSWDLDDGTIATTNTVVHTYTRGAYDVCLTAINSLGRDTICKTVDLTHVGIDGLNSYNIRIYPNPATDKIIVEAKELAGKLEIALYNIAGERVLQNTLERKTLQLDLSTLPAGVYEMQFVNEAGKKVYSNSVLVTK